MEVTKRVKIVTGLKCNIQCVFCYYRDNLHAPNRKFEEIRKDLVYARNKGISEVDFSGGEPSVHPDLPRLIEEAKSIGMEKVCIISNGLRLANKEYAATLNNAGLDEILFSVHGSGEKTHDEITRIPGSFKKISRAISNAVSEGIIIRTNTVVNRINYNDLLAVGNFLIPFHPVQMNFITINDWCFAKNLVEKLMISYSEVSPRLKEACDLLDPHVSAVNVRYIPFCFMQDYEKFVCNHRQVKYDPYEWVPRVRARLEIQNNFWRYLGILGYGYAAGGVFRKTFGMSPADILDESVVEALRRWYYKKSERCGECSLELICDGVEKTYDEQFRLDELNPFGGEKITDPVFFRNNTGSRNNTAGPDIEERACHL